MLRAALDRVPAGAGLPTVGPGLNGPQRQVDLDGDAPAGLGLCDGESGQPACRAFGAAVGRVRIGGQVELDDLAAGPVAGVGHSDRHPSDGVPVGERRLDGDSSPTVHFRIPLPVLAGRSGSSTQQMQR
jgi:hypothetical protein